MDQAQLITLFFERSTALQNYWTLFVVVIGGLLAFSSLRQRPNRLTTVLVTILFCCFAYKNCGAIHDVTLQRMAVLTSLESRVTLDRSLSNSGIASTPSTPGFADALLPTLAVPSYESVRNFHILSDVLTVLALWSMELRRRIHERERVVVAH